MKLRIVTEGLVIDFLSLARLKWKRRMQMLGVERVYVVAIPLSWQKVNANTGLSHAKGFTIGSVAEAPACSGSDLFLTHRHYPFCYILNSHKHEQPTGHPAYLRGSDANPTHQHRRRLVEKMYTSHDDFNGENLFNVKASSDGSVSLINEVAATKFLWVAASGRGTIIKIDTQTGTVKGEYRTAPAGRGHNPSRTTVDSIGNVWTGNRNEAEVREGVVYGSVVKVGLKEIGACVDRDGDQDIKTSSGVWDASTETFDALDWPNDDPSADGDGVHEAVDECILVYARTPNAGAVRHVSIDAANDVWVGGYQGYPRWFHKLNSTNGDILQSVSFGCGGYGGLVDQNGILWSASQSNSRLLRYDPSSGSGTCLDSLASYGLGIDSNGNIWNSRWTHNKISKFDPNGSLLGDYSTGGSASRGVAVTPDDDVWIANSNSGSVTRLKNDGTLLASITVGDVPTGVSVDSDGYVWVANMNSNNVMRIDPATNSVDMTVSLGVGAAPYNYGDMTGSVVPAPPNVGMWTAEFDSGVTNQEWGYVEWNANVPGDATLTVEASSSTDGVTYSAETPVTNGVDLTVPNGRYLKVSVRFVRSSSGGGSPVLYDLTIRTNKPPVAVCHENVVVDADSNCVGSVTAFVVNNGSYDPDGDTISYSLDNQGPFDLGGSTLVTLTVSDGDLEDSCTSTITVEDNEDPLAVCVQGPNPNGKTPPADNQDGFWTIRGLDNCLETAGLTVQVFDEVTEYEFPGPFDPSGTNVKYVQAPGGRPTQKKGPRMVDYQLKGKGDMVVTVTDAAGNTHSQICRVPPPPSH
eukprot:scaffold34682_cov243-Amphora_coffeaeformis.AAC.12